MLLSRDLRRRCVSGDIALDIGIRSLEMKRLKYWELVLRMDRERLRRYHTSSLIDLLEYAQSLCVFALNSFSDELVEVKLICP